ALRLEPRVIRMAGDGVELPLERRDPPAVIDVLRVDVDLHDAVHGYVQLVDRDRAVRVRELPVELVAVDPDDERSALRLRRRHVPDARQLVEAETDDDREDHDRHGSPEEPEPRRAVDLRPFLRPRPVPAPVSDDEPDQRTLDEDEDETREDRDQLVALVDA